MSATPCKATADDAAAAAAAADRQLHLLPLYALYPNITFDPPKVLATPKTSRSSAETDSSPVSTIAEEGHISFCSNSTAQTTPLRHQPLETRNLAAPDTIESYLHLAQHADLPGQCLQYFANLAQSIDIISTGFIPSTNGRYRINNSFFLDVSMTLFAEIRPPLDKTTEQITQIDRLQSLAIFQATASDPFLWTVYRQRAEMIIKSTALPSLTEKQLIHHLARLYDACVYHPAQYLFDADEIEPQTMSILNTLYDALFTWFHRYGQWCNSMKNLKEIYMEPLLKRIVASDDTLAEIKQIRKTRGDAQRAYDNPDAPGILPVDDRTVAALNLTARRKEAQAQSSKRRFQRQLTI